MHGGELAEGVEGFSLAVGWELAGEGVMDLEEDLDEGS